MVSVILRMCPVGVQRWIHGELGQLTGRWMLPSNLLASARGRQRRAVRARVTTSRTVKNQVDSSSPLQSVDAMIQPSYKGPADWFFTESGQNAWVEAMEVGRSETIAHPVSSTHTHPKRRHSSQNTADR